MYRHDPADVVLIGPRALTANSPEQAVAAAMMKEEAEWQSTRMGGHFTEKDVAK